MKTDLSPRAVAARLACLRSMAPLEDLEATRQRLATDRHPKLPFAQAVAVRLSELRALDDLTRYLHLHPR